jgi:hypothetical protein
MAEREISDETGGSDQIVSASMPKAGQCVVLGIEIDNSASFPADGTSFEGRGKTISMATCLERLGFEELAECIMGMVFVPGSLGIVVDL